MAICKVCGSENKPGARFCKSCGDRIAAADEAPPADAAGYQPCSACQAPVAIGAKFCKACGLPTEIAAVAQQEAPPLVAASNPAAAPDSVSESEPEPPTEQKLGTDDAYTPAAPPVIASLPGLEPVAFQPPPALTDIDFSLVTVTLTPEEVAALKTQTPPATVAAPAVTLEKAVAESAPPPSASPVAPSSPAVSVIKMTEAAPLITPVVAPPLPAQPLPEKPPATTPISAAPVEVPAPLISLSKPAATPQPPVDTPAPAVPLTITEAAPPVAASPQPAPAAPAPPPASTPAAPPPSQTVAPPTPRPAEKVDTSLAARPQPTSSAPGEADNGKSIKPLLIGGTAGLVVLLLAGAWWISTQKASDPTLVTVNTAPSSPAPTPAPANLPPPGAKGSLPASAAEPVPPAPTPNAPPPAAPTPPTEASPAAPATVKPAIPPATPDSKGKPNKPGKLPELANTPNPAPPETNTTNENRNAAPREEAPKPAPSPAQDWYAVLKNDLVRCNTDKDNVISLNLCVTRAKQRACGGHWDTVPECATSNARGKGEK